jgi:hypothetical protein
VGGWEEEREDIMVAGLKVTGDQGGEVTLRNRIGTRLTGQVLAGKSPYRRSGISRVGVGAAAGHQRASF